MEASKSEIRATAGGRGGGGLAAARIKQLIDLRDLRLHASVFLLACGGGVVLYGTAPNRAAANPEHVLAGYALFTVGAALTFLTLSGGARLGRAAARIEEALKGYF